MLESDGDILVQQRTIAGVFAVLGRLSSDEQANVLRDDNLSLRKRMLAAFQQEKLRPTIAYQTSVLLREDWSTLDRPTAEAKALSWWQRR